MRISEENDDDKYLLISNIILFLSYGNNFVTLPSKSRFYGLGFPRYAKARERRRRDDDDAAAAAFVIIGRRNLHYFPARSSVFSSPVTRENGLERER